MAFCSNCGAQLDSSMRFCPNCGQAQTTAVTSYTGTAYNDNQTFTGSMRSDYRVILLDLGSCTRMQARACLREYISYSLSEANTILSSLPAEVACNLSEQQANALASALTGNGMQVAVCDADDYVELNADRYGSTGEQDNSNVWLGILAVLGTLGIANRVSRISRWNRPYVSRQVFGSRRVRPLPPPPRYIRPAQGGIGRHTAPPPAMRGNPPAAVRPGRPGMGGGSRGSGSGRPGGMGRPGGGPGRPGGR